MIPPLLPVLLFYLPYVVLIGVRVGALKAVQIESKAATFTSNRSFPQRRSRREFLPSSLVSQLLRLGYVRGHFCRNFLKNAKLSKGRAIGGSKRATAVSAVSAVARRFRYCQRDAAAFLIDTCYCTAPLEPLQGDIGFPDTPLR